MVKPEKKKREKPPQSGNWSLIAKWILVSAVRKYQSTCCQIKKKDDLKHYIFTLLESDSKWHLHNFKHCHLLMSWGLRFVEGEKAEEKCNVALLVCIIMCLYNTQANYDHMLWPSVVYIILLPDLRLKAVVSVQFLNFNIMVTVRGIFRELYSLCQASALIKM